MPKTKKEDQLVENALSVISYFATSLYDKEDEDEIYWDIAKNCIHKLGLVDFVIYRVDEERNILVQRSAYGNKNPMGRRIRDRIEIVPGSGIVGSAFASGKHELIHDTSKDIRYIPDDAVRLSELAVPFFNNDEVIGIMDSEHPDVGFFTDYHVHVFTIIASLMSQRIKDLNKSRKKLTAENSYYQQLVTLMKDDLVYRNPNLSLQTLAGMLNISPTYLSYLINDVSEMNYNDFVNSFRIEAVKENLVNPEFSHYSPLSVGLDAGFNAKSTFYTAFKKVTGLTPKKYIEAHQSDEEE